MSDPGRVVATVEARMGSSRLPGKVLLPAGGRPLLEVLLHRLARAKRVDRVVLATSDCERDDPIQRLAEELGVACFRGSEQDVLQRVAGALREHEADVCVEITADCPLVDPRLVDEAVADFETCRATHRYVSNSDPRRSVPAGLDVQVFEAAALFELDAETRDPEDREHVSYGFYRPEAGDRFRPRFITHASTRGAEDLVVTLDYPEDYTLIRAAHEELGVAGADYGAAEIVAWIRANPDLHGPCLARRQEAGA